MEPLEDSVQRSEFSVQESAGGAERRAAEGVGPYGGDAESAGDGGRLVAAPTEERAPAARLLAALGRAFAWLTPQRALRLGLSLLLLAGMLTPTLWGLGRWRASREAQIAAQEARDARERRFAQALAEPDAPLCGDKLIAYAADTGRYGDRFLPPALLAAEPEELGATLRYRPARGGEGWELSIVWGSRRLAGPVRLAGKEPLAAGQRWVAALWSGQGLPSLLERLEDAPAYGLGDKLVLLPGEGETPDPSALVLDFDAALSAPSPIPEALRAASPWQAGAALRLEETGEGQIRLIFTPLRLGAGAEALFPAGTPAEELQAWVRESYEAWRRQLAFGGQAIDHPLGGGEKAIGLRDGVYIDSFLPEALRAASPEEVGLLVCRDEDGWEAIEPLSGVSLGRLEGEPGDEELAAWVAGRLDALTLLTRLPQILESGAIDPQADRLVRFRGSWARYDTEHIPQELRAQRAEQVRGVLIESSSLTGAIGFLPNEEGRYHRVSVSMETLELTLVDMYTGETIASTVLRQELPWDLVVPGEGHSFGPLRVDPQRVEDWVRENWKPQG